MKIYKTDHKTKKELIKKASTETLENHNPDKKLLTETHIELTGLKNFINNTNTNLQQLSDDIMQIAYGINEISKNASNASNLTAALHLSSSEINNATETVASKATDASYASKEIADKAEKMMENSIASRQSAISLYEETRKQLQQAIEDSKQVFEIQSLSEGIKTIANKTNMIALNASIEAARAGQSGRSFSVIADTIRELAGNSKQTVDKIQNIVEKVIDVVTLLSTNSEKILQFMNEQVINDYNSMVNVAKHYKDDASYYSNIAVDLGATSEEITSTIHEVVSTIESIADLNKNISTDIEEVATAVANSSMNSVNMLDEFNQFINHK
jgi:methyl-accepting chemotaxis protein